MAGPSNTMINKGNERLWKLRYSDPGKVITEAKKLVIRAEALGSPKGVAYARLNIAAAKFLQIGRAHV